MTLSLVKAFQQCPLKVPVIDYTWKEFCLFSLMPRVVLNLLNSNRKTHYGTVFQVKYASRCTFIIKEPSGHVYLNLTLCFSQDFMCMIGIYAFNKFGLCNHGYYEHISKNS